MSLQFYKFEFFRHCLKHFFCSLLSFSRLNCHVVLQFSIVSLVLSLLLPLKNFILFVIKFSFYLLLCNPLHWSHFGFLLCLIYTQWLNQLNEILISIV